MLSKLALAALLASFSTFVQADFYLANTFGAYGIGGGGNIPESSTNTGIGVRQEGSDCLSGQVFSCPSDTCFYGFDYFTLKAETTGEAYDFYKRDGGVQWYFSGGGQGGECFEPSGDEGECVFQTFTTTVAFDPILKCTGDFINY